jgi:two-component system chemotaxis response regulator CheY
MAILVVDDSRAMRMIVLRELRKGGWDSVGTLEADNGRAALDVVRSEKVDLILSDWNMPDMTGIEFLCELRRDGSKLPFGFVTSESSGEIRRRALESGADFVVVKPFQGDDLCREVAVLLGGNILAGLLGREVECYEGPPPAKDKVRAVARYCDASSGRSVFLVAEMTAAVAMGAALSRIPGRQAEEWSGARAMPDAIQQNFYEVANVLTKVAAPAEAGHFSLQEVMIVVDLEELPGFEKVTDDDWDQSLKVAIEGYPIGAAGFIGLKRAESVAVQGAK